MTIRFRGLEGFCHSTKWTPGHYISLWATTDRGGRYNSQEPIQAAFDEIEKDIRVTPLTLERIFNKIQLRCYSSNRTKAGRREAMRITCEIFAIAKWKRTYKLRHLTYNDLFRLANDGQGRLMDSNHFMHDLMIGIARYLRGDLGHVRDQYGNRRGIFAIPTSVGPDDVEQPVELPPQIQEPPQAPDESHSDNDSDRKPPALKSWTRTGTRLDRDTPIGERKFLERNIPKSLQD